MRKPFWPVPRVVRKSTVRGSRSKLNSKDAAERVIAEQKLGVDRKRSKTPLPKRRAELPAGGAASLHPLLTSLPPPTTSPSITAMEKSLLLEDACICTRMYARVVSEALIASSTPAELSGEDFDTLLRRERELSRAYRGPPSIFTAAALAILAGRYATDVASDGLAPLTHLPGTLRLGPHRG
jgi:hypothetical protein